MRTEDEICDWISINLGLAEIKREPLRLYTFYTSKEHQNCIELWDSTDMSLGEHLHEVFRAYFNSFSDTYKIIEVWNSLLPEFNKFISM